MTKVELESRVVTFDGAFNVISELKAMLQKPESLTALAAQNNFLTGMIRRGNEGGEKGWFEKGAEFIADYFKTSGVKEKLYEGKDELPLPVKAQVVNGLLEVQRKDVDATTALDTAAKKVGDPPKPPDGLSTETKVGIVLVVVAAIVAVVVVKKVL
jgi:hypothetical protein